MEIGGLQKLTLIDYPGRLGATVFLVGCNFRCPWCYSAELVLPEKIKLQAKISEKEFFDFLEKRKEFLEGVCITGGEPTLNKDLPDFIERIRSLSFSVKLDTNGSNPEMLESLFNKNLVDYLAMDVKAPLEREKYEIASGSKADLDKIKKSIKIIKNSKIEYEFRTTLVPGIHTKKEIIQMAKDISPAKRFYLQNFRPEKTIKPEFKKRKPYSEEFLSGVAKEISQYFELCQIR